MTNSFTSLISDSFDLNEPRLLLPTAQPNCSWQMLGTDNNIPSVLPPPPDDVPLGGDYNNGEY